MEWKSDRVQARDSGSHRLKSSLICRRRETCNLFRQPFQRCRCSALDCFADILFSMCSALVTAKRQALPIVYHPVSLKMIPAKCEGNWPGTPESQQLRHNFFLLSSTIKHKKRYEFTHTSIARLRRCVSTPGFSTFLCHCHRVPRPPGGPAAITPIKPLSEINCVQCSNFYFLRLCSRPLAKHSERCPARGRWAEVVTVTEPELPRTLDSTRAPGLYDCAVR